MGHSWYGMEKICEIMVNTLKKVMNNGSRFYWEKGYEDISRSFLENVQQYCLEK